MLLSIDMIKLICGENKIEELIRFCAIQEENPGVFSCIEETILRLIEYVKRERGNPNPYYKLLYVIGNRSPEACEVIFKDAVYCSTFNDAYHYLLEWMSSWLKREGWATRPPYSMLMYMRLLAYINHVEPSEEMPIMLKEFCQGHLEAYSKFYRHSIFLNLTKEDIRKNKYLTFYVQIAEEYALKENYMLAWRLMQVANKLLIGIDPRVQNQLRYRLNIFSQLLCACSQIEHQRKQRNSNNNPNKELLNDLIEQERWEHLDTLVTTRDMTTLLKINLSRSTMTSMQILVGELIRQAKMQNIMAEETQTSIDAPVALSDDDYLSYEPKFSHHYYIGKRQFVTAYFRLKYSEDPHTCESHVYKLLEKLMPYYLSKEKLSELDIKNQGRILVLKQLREEREAAIKQAAQSNPQ